MKLQHIATKYWEQQQLVEVVGETTLDAELFYISSKVDNSSSKATPQIALFSWQTVNVPSSSFTVLCIQHIYRGFPVNNYYITNW